MSIQSLAALFKKPAPEWYACEVWDFQRGTLRGLIARNDIENKTGQVWLLTRDGLDYYVKSFHPMAVNVVAPVVEWSENNMPLVKKQKAA